MRQKTLFSYETPFSGEHNIYGFVYGAGSYSDPSEAEPSAAIVGAMRGNEHQQLYICSKLASRLSEIEEHGDIVHGKSVLLIPSVNYSAMNDLCTYAGTQEIFLRNSVSFILHAR